MSTISIVDSSLDSVSISATAPRNHSPYAIRVRHLWHRFGAFDVLRDVTFDVEHGQIFGFIGPNGAGKTTTIRIIATLLEPMAGRVEVDGYDVAVDSESVRAIIGYMPDHAGVYERVTVREYLEFFADAYQIPHLGVVETVMELTDLEKLQDKLVVEMSKGMKQRLQLARVLLHDPKILVLDEPASDLDPRARIEMRDLLLELRALGKTIFLSSHILTELADVCTSVAILERGALVVAGPIAGIAEQLERRRYAMAYGHHAAEDRPAQLPSSPQGQPQQASATGVEAPGGQSAVQPAVTPGGVPVPGSARKRLKLRVLTDANQAAQLLWGGPGILEVEVHASGNLLVGYQGSDALIADLVRHLVTHGVAVVGVEPERSELERIFLEVTQGEVQ
ncbi:MAG TPA: ABC transporter ATP-binding protein [Polyangiaceae bacterium]|jgi:ABC-2 type transport system ATP-binding protein|nr:ABC transporter ATP-binding protein [Polyangiaceae bacterium]HNZ23857.1 ABC transporter ATP-binding protein [Polyangiaceae bacterium]HOD22350.1 ABC transporter ATP-binding protein [Polyangiaceae bacterium]HOE50251.1 ABC transporter ATP-binding protein [Polyangiaceae bacterium]HOH01625.1 ABC transporter ATP-binding protein [Polyangiaceae bacterium]